MSVSKIFRPEHYQYKSTKRITILINRLERYWTYYQNAEMVMTNLNISKKKLKEPMSILLCNLTNLIELRYLRLAKKSSIRWHFNISSCEYLEDKKSHRWWWFIGSGDEIKPEIIEKLKEKLKY